jgi:hypothetical protein
MKALALLALLLVGAAASSIQGDITDEAGKPVGTATVTAKDSKGKSAGTAKSDKKGTFTFKGLPPGEYTLEFSAKGYETEKQSNVTVSAGGLTEVDMVLRAAGKSLRPKGGGW